MTKGGCICGAVRYAWKGAPKDVGYCHCRSCRHHSGAAVAGMLVFARDAVTVTGPLKTYASSPGIQRGFCAHCGTSLTWAGPGLISVHIGTLDDPDAHPPTLHWRYDERCVWSAQAGDLPHVVMDYDE